jgi:hypothetical protein
MRASCSGVHGVLPPLQPRPEVPSTSTILPALPDMLMVPSASVDGSGAPLLPPPSPTRKYCPGCKMASGSATSWPAFAPKLPVPVALAYCNDVPVSATGVLPRLNSSTKSRL